jgi:hypothetical protein
MTDGFSITHWLVMLVVCAIFLVPVWRILRRAGHSGWWVLVAFVPLINLIGLWIFAFTPWPALRAPAAESSGN